MNPSARRTPLSRRGTGEHVARELAGALRSLHAEVEMGEAVGICLPDRVPALRAGMLLDRHQDYLPEVGVIPSAPRHTVPPPRSLKQVDRWTNRILKVNRHVLAVTQGMPERVVLREIVPRGMCFAWPVPFDPRLGSGRKVRYELAIHPETWAAIKDNYPQSGHSLMIWGMRVQEDVAA